MWKAGQDPTLRMTVGIVLVLDHAPSYDSLLERFAAVIKRSPRLQSRPGDPSLIHASPMWVEDDALDAEHHLRTAALSPPGSLRQLLDLVGLVAANAVRDPETINAVVRGFRQALDLATSVSRQVVITGGSLSPLMVDHSMTTRFEVISIPGARAAARVLGGSRNDLLVAGAASGLGLYHERLGVPCQELRLPRPPLRVAATGPVVTGSPPRASRCRRRRGSSGRTSRSSPSD